MDARSILFCVTGLTVSACNGPGVATSGFDDLGEIAERDVQLVDAPGSMCTHNRIVGRAPGAECPAPANPEAWTVKNVLEGGTDYLAANHVDLPGAAGRYCSYEWKPTGAPTADQVTTLLGQLQAASTECMSVQPLSPPEPPVPQPMNEVIGPILQALFQDRAGIVHAEELQRVNHTSSENTRANVRVSIVDVDPTVKTDYFNYDHGEMLKRMIMDIACPATAPQDCKVNAVRVLGLPRVSPLVADYTHGGKGGYPSEIAAGLMEAHRRWAVAGGTEKHFINLSVGWQDEPFGMPAASAHASAEMVRTALRYLSCRGEIVIAAAGNGDPLTCSNEGVYPARWQTEAAPTAAQCVTILGVADQAHLPVPIPPGPRPLVYAVAGTTLAGELLATTPELSVAPLVAIADHGIGGAPENTAMVGTSVGTAVATGAAAMTASYMDTGNGWDAMQLVFTGGGATTIPITMALPGTGGNAKQVDVCGALTAACNGWGSCPFGTPCTPNTAELELGELDFDYGGVEWSPAGSYGEIDECTESESICGIETYALALDDFETPPDACEWNFIDPAVVYVKPQPPKPPCPACTLTTEEKRLYFTLSPDFLASDVSNITLHITDGTTGTEMSVDLGDPPINSTGTTILTLPNAVLYPGIVVKRAVVDVKISGNKETNDVLVR